MPKKILVSPSPELIPVFKLLYKQNRDIQFICMHPDNLRMLKDLDLPTAGMGDFINAETQVIASKECARIISYLFNMKHDTNLYPSVLKWLDSELLGYLYPRISEIATLSIAMQNAQPDLAIVHNDVEPIMRAVAQSMRVQKKPCLHIPHAIYIDNPERTPMGSDVHDIITASHIVVAGPYQAQWFHARGGKIHATGLPQLDKWAHMTYDTKQARRILGLNEQKPVVTFASSWRQDTNLWGATDGLEESYSVLLQVMQSLPDMQFIIKLHPRANNGEWHAKLAQEANVDCLITAAHLETVLQATDVLLAYGPSGIVIEAGHLPHIRLMSIRGFHEDNEVVTVEADFDQIGSNIVRCLNEGPINTSAFVYKYAGVPDGLATQRVAKYTLELLETGKT